MTDPDIGSVSDKDSPPARSARSVLVTVLGELVEPCGRPVRTAALLYVLRGLGFGEPAARQALARTGSSGLIAAQRVGRETLWHLTEKAHRLFAEGDMRVFPPEVDVTQWDGRWLVINVPVPESHRSSRKKLYAALRWAGFGNPTPGVWVTPHIDRAAEAARTIESLGLTDNTVTFVGPIGQPGITEAELVRRSWDLGEAEKVYDELLTRFDVREFSSADELLITHLQLADSLRRMPYLDPRLPEVLLPDWAGLQAAKRLRDLRTEWTPAAHARWREIAGIE
ncbi:PaaX family transcriptional regulator [Rhodococcus sp. NPDC003382]|uniref:PaaX family transcriptional regulator n=1 Tax=unclassified Rhodococcus (in: high G+C Gram-positive bacteria) TaxID=192944 RepID=UPI00200A9513|nr:PaaX family transcriptional regulator C-terminal domain-containing protein [Rhodococcus sp. HM1]MCK8671499.1 phenylacetic acid degradation protein PaaX [Rhodococcus sp. HM1]